VAGKLILIVTAVAGAGVLAFAAAGRPEAHAASVATVRVPNVVGFRLDRATRTLHNAGLRVNEECSGLFGCIVKSRWEACEQDPQAGTRLQRYAVVVVYAERAGNC
jgi:beta-lactam-binding protein with PASTA domain